MNINQLLKTLHLKQIVGLDFETYFEQGEYSLRSPKTAMSEYVRDERFKAQCVAMQTNKQKKARWKPDVEIETFLKTIDWSVTGLLCHNTAFDAFILSQHYNIVPAFYFDTLSMARPLFSNHIGAGLDEVARYLGYAGKEKGDALQATKGIRELPPELMKALGEYNVDDVQDMMHIFRDMLAMDFPLEELKLIHHTIKAFADPVAEVDVSLAKKELANERRKKTLLMKKVIAPMGLNSIEEVKANLTKNEVFAQSLRDNGVEAPKKPSPTAGKDDIYAFAKGDLDFQALQKHGRVVIRDLVEARLAVKSTIGETRAARMVLRGTTGDCKLPLMLNYGKAHTLRWSGGDKFNPQNFVRGGNMRKCIKAPKGYKIVVVDSSQIEARMNAWLWGQNDLLELFATGKDPYKALASEIYGAPVDRISKTQRFVGKVACFSKDTKVLCDVGWLPIYQVTGLHKVWNGEQWVCQQGAVMRGLKKTETLLGVSVTPEHLVLSATRWQSIRSIQADENGLSQALERAAENLPLQGIYSQKNLKVFQEFWSTVIAARASIQSTLITSKILNQHDATYALKPQELKSVIGNMQKLCQTMLTELDSLTDYPQLLADATTRITQVINIMGNEAFTYTPHGIQTNLPSSNTSKPLKAGIIQLLKWIDEIIIAGMSPETYASVLEKTTLTIDVLWKTLKAKSESSKKKTYDLVNCEHGNRFTILTAGGPLIVHNCLGLGYQMGAEKFQYTLEAGLMGPPMKISLAEAEKAKNAYRRKNHRIVAGWYFLENMLTKMMLGEDYILNDILYFHKEAITTPSGFNMHYPEMHAVYNHKYERYQEFSYKSGRFRSHIYGGMLAENVIQHLARLVVAEQLLVIAERYRIITMTHDEVVYLAKNREAKQALKFGLEAFRVPSDWCSDIPLDAEGGYDDIYSK